MRNWIGCRIKAWFLLVLLAASAHAASKSGTHIRLNEYPIPTADPQPGGITAGPDGALWFTEVNANKIGRITTAGEAIDFPLTSGTLVRPLEITAGPDDALWFAPGGGSIGRITTEGGVAQYPFTGGSDTAIAAGPDGAMWFAVDSANEIGRLTTSGVQVEFPVPTAKSDPLGITAGPDGALWFTEHQANKIGRISVDGVVTNEYRLKKPHGPLSITSGPDGALWFTESNGIIGRITTTGEATQYTSHATTFGAGGDIAPGPEGAIWFTGPESDQVGRVTMDGVITEYTLPTPGAEPFGVTAGPDGNIWFTESGMPGNKIGRMPACGLGLRASYTAGTLTVNLEPGIDRPAIWTLDAGTGYGFTKHIKSMTPPKPFTFTYANYPNVGKLRITSKLTDEKGREYCSEWTGVDTAPH